MKELKITDNLYMKQDSYNVTIFEKVTSNKLDKNRKPTGETYQTTKDICYCGNVYQALTWLIKSNYCIDKSLLDQFKNMTTLIDTLEQDIKNRFRIEVKKA